MASRAIRNHTWIPSGARLAPNHKVRRLGSRQGSSGVRLRGPPGQSSRVPLITIFGSSPVMFLRTAPRAVRGRSPWLRASNPAAVSPYRVTGCPRHGELLSFATARAERTVRCAGTGTRARSPIDDQVAHLRSGRKIRILASGMSCDVWQERTGQAGAKFSATRSRGPRPALRRRRARFPAAPARGAVRTDAAKAGTAAADVGAADAAGPPVARRCRRMRLCTSLHGAESVPAR